MTLDTAPFRRAGLSVEPADFERLVAEAVERILPSRAPVDARNELTEDEQRFLEESGVDLAEFVPRDRGVSSPLALTAADYAALLATALTVPDLASRLGVDTSRIRQRLARHTLYGIKDSTSWRIPLFQLDDASSRLVPGLHRVAPHWVGVHPVEVARWFTLPHVDLEDAGERRISPRDWLLAGGDAGVVAALAEELHGVA
ncbi:MAG TPA: DNA-binding protein [Chloroflexota bacterium]|nr:DNA-binding protein [Chloroflexota bacterium]